MAHNLVVDDVRSVRHRHESVTATLPERATVDRSDALFDAMVIECALAELSLDHRAAVVLAYYGGRTVPEIGRELDLAEGTVKSRLHYGPTALRFASPPAGLTSEGGDPVSAHDARFDDWDGAYVLGALSADDRRDYEEHLRTCDRCRADVAEFGGLPGLLSRIEPERALALIDTEHPAVALRPDPLTPPADLAARLHRRARQRRHRPPPAAAGCGRGRDRRRGAGRCLGARGADSDHARSDPDRGSARPTTAIGSNAELTASVRLYRKAWGTEVDTQCRHAHSSSTKTAGTAEAGEGYGLYLVDAARTPPWSPAGWNPQSPITTTAATATQVEDIRRLELRSLQDQTVLLAAPVNGCGGPISAAGSAPARVSSVGTTRCVARGRPG